MFDRIDRNVLPNWPHECIVLTHWLNNRIDRVTALTAWPHWPQCLTAWPHWPQCLTAWPHWPQCLHDRIHRNVWPNFLHDCIVLTHWLNDPNDRMTPLTAWPHWPHDPIDRMTPLTAWPHWSHDPIDRMTPLTAWPHRTHWPHWPHWPQCLTKWPQWPRWKHDRVAWTHWQPNPYVKPCFDVTYRILEYPWCRFLRPRETNSSNDNIHNLHENLRSYAFAIRMTYAIPIRYKILVFEITTGTGDIVKIFPSQILILEWVFADVESRKFVLRS